MFLFCFFVLLIILLDIRHQSKKCRVRKKYKDKTTGPTVKLIYNIQKYVFMQEKLVIEDKHPRIKIIIDVIYYQPIIIMNIPIIIIHLVFLS